MNKVSYMYYVPASAAYYVGDYLCRKFKESHSLYNITSCVTRSFNNKILPIDQKSTVKIIFF